MPEVVVLMGNQKRKKLQPMGGKYKDSFNYIRGGSI